MFERGAPVAKPAGFNSKDFKLFANLIFFTLSQLAQHRICYLELRMHKLKLKIESMCFSSSFLPGPSVGGIVASSQNFDQSKIYSYMNAQSGKNSKHSIVNLFSSDRSYLRYGVLLYIQRHPTF